MTLSAESLQSALICGSDFFNSEPQIFTDFRRFHRCCLRNRLNLRRSAVRIASILNRRLTAD